MIYHILNMYCYIAPVNRISVRNEHRYRYWFIAFWQQTITGMNGDLVHNHFDETLDIEVIIILKVIIVHHISPLYTIYA